MHFFSDILEEDEEESDRDIERQNIEELYDYVRHTHQKEIKFLKENVQHSALIPVLRPYQSEAVNWMLRRENFRSSPTSGKYLEMGRSGRSVYSTPFLSVDLVSTDSIILRFQICIWLPQSSECLFLEKKQNSRFFRGNQK